jgi:predicted membrane-bound spermidine synthase
MSQKKVINYLKQHTKRRRNSSSDVDVENLQPINKKLGASLQNMDNSCEENGCPNKYDTVIVDLKDSHKALSNKLESTASTKKAKKNVGASESLTSD